MEPLNTYTYWRSELPPMTAEIQSEIASIDFTVANLILKIQGNYLALNALVETLADGLNSAESNLCSIRIIPDGDGDEAVERAIGFTDLPIREKQLLIFTATTSTAAIKMIATMLGCSFRDAVDHISRQSEAQFEGMTPEQLDEVVARLAEEMHKQPDESFSVTQA